MTEVVVDPQRWVTQTGRGSRTRQVELRRLRLGDDMAKIRRSTGTQEVASGALPSPETARDPDWAAKIAKAREAREAARKVRKGKPATFPTRVVP